MSPTIWHENSFQQIHSRCFLLSFCFLCVFLFIMIRMLFFVSGIHPTSIVVQSTRPETLPRQCHTHVYANFSIFYFFLFTFFVFVVSSSMFFSFIFFSFSSPSLALFLSCFFFPRSSVEASRFFFSKITFYGISDPNRLHELVGGHFVPNFHPSYEIEIPSGKSCFFHSFIFLTSHRSISEWQLLMFASYSRNFE